MKINFEKSIKISGNSAKNLIYMCPSKEYIFFSQENSKNIIGLNRKIQNEIKITTEAFLGPLSFDVKEEYFWAVSLEELPKIYKINLKGETILKLDIHNIIPDNYIMNEIKPIIISSLTINNDSNEILISIKGTNHIYILDKLGEFKKAILDLQIEEITDMKLLDDKLFINCKNKIYLFNNNFKNLSNGNMEFLDEVDIKYSEINSFIVTKINNNLYKILFLLFFRNAKHLCSGELIIEKVIDTVNSITLPNNTTLPNSSVSGIPLNTQSIPNIPQSDITEEYNIYKVIELIAKEEAALVDLISTQGKTLKNVMQNNNNIDELILINKSLNSFLDKMIKVEIGLTNKLKEAEKIAEKIIHD
ncbi:hypothetical protein [Clostridium tarantellae]|uniref:Uncharacterized protein n=1 Tax=Clostridium tarantellae TaxID=39493 RepID=A0A6I1MR50_9CLOT|nr:hypothetical protein [Clostridium tarantellae]MPQ44938.1 hypothetical protein [Clostridium tarantellae]